MENWEVLQINEDATVFDAIKVINSTSASVALVVNNKRELVGTITDGDVRRGILQSVTLQDNVRLILKKQPVVGDSDDSEESHLEILERFKINQLPLINQQKKLRGLFIVGAKRNFKHKQNAVVLMVGGLGSRLGELTVDCPKPMLKIGGRPILETIINGFKDEGYRSFYLAVNYKSEMIEDYFGNGSHHGINIQYIREKKRMGTAGSLSLLEGEVSEPIVVMNGDLLTSININEMINFHHETGAIATMCVREYSFQLPFGVVISDGDKMKEVQEKPIEKRFVNAGIYVLNPSVLKRIPNDEFFDMPTLFNHLLNDNEVVSVFPITEYWLDIGRREDFDRAHLEFREVFET